MQLVPTVIQKDAWTVGLTDSIVLIILFVGQKVFPSFLRFTIIGYR